MPCFCGNVIEFPLLSSLSSTKPFFFIFSGVDVNLAAMHTHKAHTLQFVSGLGPRKAQAMITKINQLGGKLESRASLIKERICGSQIFMNASSFLRIRRYHFIQKGDEMWDVLDDTRIHPEDYDLARKMAADAIEVEEPLEEDENPSLYVQDLMDGDRDKLDLLLLDDYAIELEKSLNEPKRITLNEIKNELKNPYRERRQRFHPPTIDRIFSMFTHETDTTLYPNMIVACRVIRVLERLVKVALNSGLDGLIHIKNMDAGDVATVAELGFYEDQVLKCRVLNVVKDRFMVELSVKQDDVYGRGSGAAVIKDKYFCNDWEHADLAQKEGEKKERWARQFSLIAPSPPCF